ncbi:hypothetical protein [Streptomyces sp. cmx-4-9]|uniref:hypothetical protein n=1 Tax=Streptomyces sp. cmx-4-9 TaxID=2790941 RepID=UPI00397F01B0
MAGEKSLAAQGVGQAGIGMVVVHDAGDEELDKVIPAVIACCAGKALRRSGD